MRVVVLLLCLCLSSSLAAAFQYTAPCFPGITWRAGRGIASAACSKPRGRAMVAHMSAAAPEKTTGEIAKEAAIAGRSYADAIAAAGETGPKVKEGGIGSIGGIILSRDAIRELSNDAYLKEILRVPWVREGGVGSTGAITLSREAIRELKKYTDNEILVLPKESAPSPAKPISAPSYTAAADIPAKSNTPSKTQPAPSKTPLAAPKQVVDKPVTLGLAAALMGNNEKAKEMFGFLQSRTFSKDREGFILGDVFADGVIRNGGFTEFAEKVNGRVAQLAFPIGLTQTFDGDLLDQLAANPMQALALSSLILYASLPPLFDTRADDRRGISVFKASVPAEVRKGLMEQYRSGGLDKIFTEEAERTNSRAAMIAVGFWLLTACLF